MFVFTLIDFGGLVCLLVNLLYFFKLILIVELPIAAEVLVVFTIGPTLLEIDPVTAEDFSYF